MNSEDKRKIKLYRNAYPEESQYMSDEDVLIEVKWIKKNYKRLNNIFSKAVKVYNDSVTV
jgi:hypothetical protein